MTTQSVPTADQVRLALKWVIDPEIGLNVVDLGLIYDVTVADSGEVQVAMTLTTRNCPMGEVLPEQCRQVIKTLTGNDAVTITLVWEPAWSPERISEAGRRQLNGP